MENTTKNPKVKIKLTPFSMGSQVLLVIDGKEIPIPRVKKIEAIAEVDCIAEATITLIGVEVEGEMNTSMNEDQFKDLLNILNYKEKQKMSANNFILIEERRDGMWNVSLRDADTGKGDHQGANAKSLEEAIDIAHDIEQECIEDGFYVEYGIRVVKLSDKKNAKKPSNKSVRDLSKKI